MDVLSGDILTVDKDGLESLKMGEEAIGGKRKKKRDGKNNISKSMANVQLVKKKKKNKKHKKDKIAKVAHATTHHVDCSAWGCPCKKRKEAKREATPEKKERPIPVKRDRPKIDYGNRMLKIHREYPALYKWDQKQQLKLKAGEITKEEYLKQREE